MLQLPGLTSTALVAAVPAATGGLAKLDGKIIAILAQNKVTEAHMAALGDAGVESAAIFGHVARTEEKLLKFLKTTLNLDDDARPADAVPIAKLVMAWEMCRKRTEVETEVAAQRAVNHLPPQLAIDDHQTAREAFEKKEGNTFANHKIPSEA